MTELEKVKKGMECCTNDVHDPYACRECPYLGHKPTRDGCIKPMLLDALALLKALEPRLLTLEEVLNAEDFVWAEIYSTLKWRWCVICVRIGPVAGNEEVVKIEEDCGIAWTKNKSEYGKRGFLDGGWRCWSARPTEELRKAVKWE